MRFRFPIEVSEILTLSYSMITLVSRIRLVPARAERLQRARPLLPLSFLLSIRRYSSLWLRFSPQTGFGLSPPWPFRDCLLHGAPSTGVYVCCASVVAGR